MENKSLIWQQAFDWGMEHYPNAPASYHHAFASVIQFACTFKDRRSVIETMRTLVAMDVIHHNHSSPIKFEQALQLLVKTCYGPITIEHAKKYKHDRPEGEEAADIWDAQRFIEQFSKILISKKKRDQ
jgi:hypothetical protein